MQPAQGQPGVEQEIAERVSVAELARQSRLTRTILWVLIACVVLTVLLSLTESSNRLDVTLGLYVPALCVLFVALWLQRSGRARIAGWMVSWLFWAIVFCSTWLFGGLDHEMGAAYCVAVMIAAATLGSRAALFFCGVSILGASLVLWAELAGFLPEPVEALSVINSWISVTMSLLIASVLVYLIMHSLRAAMVRELELASERDAVKVRYLQAQKMEPVGRLASGIAHDFNNLLTVIAGVSSVLRQAPRDDQLVKSLLDDLDSATARAGLMTSQLLAFTRKRPENVVVLDVGAALQAVVPMLARLLGEDVEVQLSVPEEPQRIRISRPQFEQLVLNLAVNAREAMPQGGKFSLSVRASEAPAAVLLRVEDTGVGIEAGLLDQIFTPFFSNKPTGSGLGLSTVSDIVASFGGSVRVSSEVGRGSCFEVTFPRESAGSGVTEPALATPKKAAEVQQRRVLLVEDHDLVRRTNRRTLEQHGYEITAVVDGVEALALIDGGARFDVIVSDIVMPRMNGIELVLALAERRRATPVLVVSGNYDKLPEELAGLPFTVRFEKKPFSAKALLEALAATLDDAALRLAKLERAQPGLISK